METYQGSRNLGDGSGTCLSVVEHDDPERVLGNMHVVGSCTQSLSDLTVNLAGLDVQHKTTQGTSGCQQQGGDGGSCELLCRGMERAATRSCWMLSGATPRSSSARRAMAGVGVEDRWWLPQSSSESLWPASPDLADGRLAPRELAEEVGSRRSYGSEGVLAWQSRPSMAGQGHRRDEGCGTTRGRGRRS
ncbi:hypothetical protein TRIUR3_21937 [Triticum urartu]|uniref:Uncharacterized protein n=1 Tax=Triticum urartu TaxID=4572 RepID=M7YHX2_TRIUA|nr:hypothetical protein TRIUR3_21937 [Triticum urartu]